ncbi:MAG: PQQ-binding-like beta-propeller repeat protein [Planctomycetota bacterium]
MRAFACVALIAASASSQQVVLQQGGFRLGRAPQKAANADEDPGVIVEMFENPNLDRYLHRAREFLDRSAYSQAIDVLQDVIEGRTVEVVALRPEDEAGAVQPGDGQPGDGQPDGGRSRAAPPNDPDAADPGGVAATELDARNSVFSQDGRLFRPVRRLCHELLAKLPDIGVQIYRTQHEAQAQELLDKALVTGSIVDLERVANRYFITLPAGRAMLRLADLQMHRGRYRAAVQVYRDLLETYPADNRRKLGVRDVWCRFKIALCLRLSGERDAAQAAVEGLAESHQDESLRILGQLESVESLQQSELFSRDVVAIEGSSRAGEVPGLTLVDGDLVPLWQYRFAEPNPYKDPKAKRNSRTTHFFGGSPGRTSMPFANRYGPATWVAFSSELNASGVREPRALFMEHFRLSMTDAASGILIQQGDGENEPPLAREGYPRVRVAAADQALLRPVEDRERRYVILGHEGNAVQNEKPLATSKLRAYRKSDWGQAWTSEDWLEGDDGLRGVTFLAAPSIFGESLLLPALRNGSYSLECIDRRSGEPLWHTPLHSGGSKFWKAPGCRVVVQGGTAYCSTNAGCLAAVDAFAGDLRWIRRYERVDTVHKMRKRRRKSPGNNLNVRFGNGGATYAQAAIDGFAPSDLIVRDGLVIFAPCDGYVIAAIDAATGDAVWMLDGTTIHAPYGRINEVVGHNDELLFATSTSHLVCIELEGGLLRWQQPLPSWSGRKTSGRGRGAVLDDVVILPNQRELLVFDCANSKPMRRISLPDFDEGREPLGGSCNLVVDGPWLAVGYAGGVEVYSSKQALGALAGAAEDPVRRAHYLTRSSDGLAAEKVLAAAAASSEADEDQRRRAAQSLVRLVRQRAIELASSGDLPAALAAMDEIQSVLGARSVRLDWHLSRVELCKTAGDMARHATEQQMLYEYMEGRG